MHAALKNDSQATTIAIVIYTLVGLATYITGRLQEKRRLLIYGGSVLGVVVFRLLTFDIWQMQLTERIITFVLIGILLMATAFIGRKK